MRGKGATRREPLVHRIRRRIQESKAGLRSRLGEPTASTPERAPQFDGDVLDAHSFAAATERALAHCENRAIVMIDLEGRHGDLALGEIWGALMAAVEARTSRTIRPDDVLGRLGADRLAILTGTDGGKAAADSVAARLADRLGEPFRVGGREVELRPRIGVGHRVGDADTADAIFRRADAVAR
jgi:GGDEF domain-containing protein